MVEVFAAIAASSSKYLNVFKRAEPQHNKQRARDETTISNDYWPLQKTSPTTTTSITTTSIQCDASSTRPDTGSSSARCKSSAMVLQLRAFATVFDLFRIAISSLIISLLFFVQSCGSSELFQCFHMVILTNIVLVTVRGTSLQRPQLARKNRELLIASLVCCCRCYTKR